MQQPIDQSMLTTAGVIVYIENGQTWLQVNKSATYMLILGDYAPKEPLELGELQ